ncbi:hypothetical protein BH23DEI1_BH23DEI1_19090 [soil metagenome]|nr:hypothetical protein [Trueperaceae bacterium]
MRTPVQLRRQALLGALGAMAFALLVSFALSLLLGRQGRLGFGSFNVWGIVEGLVFVIAFTNALRYARGVLRLPTPTLLTFGLSAPPSAAKVAASVPVVDAANLAQTLAENRMIIVSEGGVPIGISGVRRERLLSWDELVKVDGAVAVTDLRRVLAHERVVIVTEGDRVIGVVTQDMYLAGLWGTVR